MIGNGHSMSRSSAAVPVAASPSLVLLFNLPEITLEPNFPFAPLSLQVLRDGLRESGAEAVCFDLASYGPRIAELLTADQVQLLFRTGRESGYLNAVENFDLELAPDCREAVEQSGLIDRVLRLVEEFRPMLIGLSIQGTPQSSDLFAAGLCKLLARMLRSNHVDCPIVVGGARTVEKENIQKELMSEAGIDYLVRGNGQRSIGQLARGLLANALDCEEVHGLVYRAAGALRIAPKCDPPWGHMAVPIWVDEGALTHYRRTLRDLSPQCRHVPELRDMLDLSICAVPFQFTVGCVSECAFCNRASEIGKVSRPGDVVDQLEVAVKEYGVQEFLFLNSELNFGRTYVDRFCDEIIRRRLGIRWIDSCEFRGLDSRMLEKMRDAGCVGLWFGLESVSERLLKFIQKRVTVSHAIEMLQAADRLGIYNCLNFICGLPYENEPDVQETLSFLKNHHELVDTTQVNIFYLQGGPFVDTPDKFGLSLRGYQEQVGLTVSKAFDEVRDGGLRWEEKKLQMRSSFQRVRNLNDQYFSRDSQNMLLALALNKAFGGNKVQMRGAIRRMADPTLGNFLVSESKIIRHDGEIFLIDTANQQVMRVNEIVARCWDFRHLMIWSRIRNRLLSEFDPIDVDATLGSIRELEGAGHFRPPRPSAGHNAVLPDVCT